jgi:hypothetical protein
MRARRRSDEPQWRTVPVPSGQVNDVGPGQSGEKGGRGPRGQRQPVILVPVKMVRKSQAKSKKLLGERAQLKRDLDESEEMREQSDTENNRLRQQVLKLERVARELTVRYKRLKTGVTLQPCELENIILKVRLEERDFAKEQMLSALAKEPTFSFDTVVHTTRVAKEVGEQHAKTKTKTQCSTVAHQFDRGKKMHRQNGEYFVTQKAAIFEDPKSSAAATAATVAKVAKAAAATAATVAKVAQAAAATAATVAKVAQAAAATAATVAKVAKAAAATAATAAAVMATTATVAAATVAIAWAATAAAAAAAAAAEAAEAKAAAATEAAATVATACAATAAAAAAAATVATAWAASAAAAAAATVATDWATTAAWSARWDQEYRAEQLRLAGDEYTHHTCGGGGECARCDEINAEFDDDDDGDDDDDDDDDDDHPDGDDGFDCY